MDLKRFAQDARQTMGPNTDHAYKGYLIKTNPLRNEIFIQKDGHHIGYAKSLDEAMRIIDQLV